MRKKDDFDYLAEALYEDEDFGLALKNSDDPKLIDAVAAWLRLNCAEIGSAREGGLRTRGTPNRKPLAVDLAEHEERVMASDAATKP